MSDELLPQVVVYDYIIAPMLDSVTRAVSVKEL